MPSTLTASKSCNKSSKSTPVARPRSTGKRHLRRRTSYGHGRIDYLKRKYGEVAIAVMRVIKGAIDPQGLMNPGKLLIP
ncbi:FAD-linked oxidase C-terminal domain-containing protein [Halotalea alkalilenta]|uniref:FAD-linked oxidase C-terminal domain-containing protein n=1 Tax=Halotalea alkalilenta TaxID=376489 RepID=UPI001CBF3321